MTNIISYQENELKLRYHCTVTIMAEFKYTDHTKHWEDVKQLELSYAANRKVKW